MEAGNESIVVPRDGWKKKVRVPLLALAGIAAVYCAFSFISHQISLRRLAEQATRDSNANGFDQSLSQLDANPIPEAQNGAIPCLKTLDDLVKTQGLVKQLPFFSVLSFGTRPQFSDFRYESRGLDYFLDQLSTQAANQPNGDFLAAGDSFLQFSNHKIKAAVYSPPMLVRNCDIMAALDESLAFRGALKWDSKNYEQASQDLIASANIARWLERYPNTQTLMEGAKIDEFLTSVVGPYSLNETKDTALALEFNKKLLSALGKAPTAEAACKGDGSVLAHRWAYRPEPTQTDSLKGRLNNWIYDSSDSYKILSNSLLQLAASYDKMPSQSNALKIAQDSVALENKYGIAVPKLPFPIGTLPLTLVQTVALRNRLTALVEAIQQFKTGATVHVDAISKSLYDPLSQKNIGVLNGPIYIAAWAGPPFGENFDISAGSTTDKRLTLPSSGVPVGSQPTYWLKVHHKIPKLGLP